MKFWEKMTVLTGVAFASVTMAATAFAQPRDEYWHGPGMMWGGGFGMLFGWVFSILILAGLVILIVLGLRAFGLTGANMGLGGNTAQADRAMEILKERFAKGEIDAKEFAERKRHLSD